MGGEEEREGTESTIQQNITLRRNPLNDPNCEGKRERRRDPFLIIHLFVQGKERGEESGASKNLLNFICLPPPRRKGGRRSS